MSRSRRACKRVKEAWSRRASAAGVSGWDLDAAAKTWTHRIERRQAREVLRVELGEVARVGVVG